MDGTLLPYIQKNPIFVLRNTTAKNKFKQITFLDTKWVLKENMYLYVKGRTFMYKCIRSRGLKETSTDFNDEATAKLMSDFGFNILKWEQWPIKFILFWGSII